VPEVSSTVKLFSTIMLWRLYAFIGRQKLGWGIRKFIIEKYSHTINHTLPQISSTVKLFSTIMLWRFYAVIGRQKLGWGIRKSIINFSRRLISKKNNPFR
jgi:hypothetical protein